MNNIIDFDVLVGGWVGDVKGTHVGKAFLEFKKVAGQFVAELRLNIEGNLSRATGEVQPTTGIIIFREAAPSTSAAPQITGQFQIIEQQGGSFFWGRWESSTGAGGTAQFASERPNGSTSNSSTGGQVPRQLIIKFIDVPPITMSKRSLLGLLDKLEQSLPKSIGTVLGFDTATQTKRGYAQEWFKFSDLPTTLDNLSITRFENTTEIQKTISVELKKNGTARVTTQGTDETWCVGTAIAVSDFLKLSSSVWLARLRKYGFNFTLFALSIFVSLVSPDVEFAQRAVLLVSFLLVIFLFDWITKKLTSTTVFLDDTDPGWWRKNMPAIVTGILSTIAATAIIALFTDVAKKILERAAS